MFRFYQHKLRHKVLVQKYDWKSPFQTATQDWNKLSFYFVFVSDTFSTKSTNFLLRFRRNKHFRLFSSDCAIKCRTCEWRHRLFGAKLKWKPCKRRLATSSLAHPLRVRKITIRSPKVFSWDSREVDLWQVYALPSCSSYTTTAWHFNDVTTCERVYNFTGSRPIFQQKREFLFAWLLRRG